MDHLLYIMVLIKYDFKGDDKMGIWDSGKNPTLGISVYKLTTDLIDFLSSNVAVMIHPLFTYPGIKRSGNIKKINTNHVLTSIFLHFLPFQNFCN